MSYLTGGISGRADGSAARAAADAVDPAASARTREQICAFARGLPPVTASRVRETRGRLSAGDGGYTYSELEAQLNLVYPHPGRIWDYSNIGPRNRELRRSGVVVMLSDVWRRRLGGVSWQSVWVLREVALAEGLAILTPLEERTSKLHILLREAREELETGEFVELLRYGKLLGDQLLVDPTLREFD